MYAYHYAFSYPNSTLWFRQLSGAKYPNVGTGAGLRKVGALLLATRLSA